MDVGIRDGAVGTDIIRPQPPSPRVDSPVYGGNVGNADKRGPLRGERGGTASAVTEGVFRAPLCYGMNSLRLAALRLDSSLGEGALPTSVRDRRGDIVFFTIV